MAFGLNRAEVIGRLGADVTINHLASGGRVANLSIATDESYIDRQTGERVDRTEWHRIVTFQNGLVDMFEQAREEGPSGLRRGQAPDPALEEGRRGTATGSRPRSCWCPVAASSSSTSPPAPTATAPRRPTVRPCPPPRDRPHRSGRPGRHPLLAGSSLPRD